MTAKEAQSCIGFSETVRTAKRDTRQRRETKPQPWIVLKLMVLVTFGIMCYTFYVFTHKFVVPMLIREDEAMGTFGTGIALLVIFVLLWLWMFWAYVRVVVTGPGKAVEFVKPSARPVPRTQADPHYYPLDSLGASRRPSASTTSHIPITRTSIGGPSYEELRASTTEEPQAGVLNALPNPVAPPRNVDPVSIAPTSDRPELPVPISALKRDKKDLQRHISRVPPSNPVLLPEHRYCHRCSIVKPYRTHHCRSCGTCILKYDHHCPWVGQCIGARNHKFFLNFTTAAAVFALYTFTTLLSVNLISQNNGERFSGDWDPQVIVVVAIAALFSLFTISLAVSHIRLVSIGQSTVESMRVHDFKEMEDERLTSAFGMFNFTAKNAKRREWDRFWGRIGYEGNIWWMGNARREWESVMGTNPLGWIFPIGKSPADGLSYEVNPRFSENGIWRPRRDWPAELQ